MTRSIFSYLLALTMILSGCSSAPKSIQSSGSPTGGPRIEPVISTLTPGADQQTISKEFIGRVVDMDGNPIAGSQVESSGVSATSDRDGWFRFSGSELPQWVKVTAAGYISRTRAVAPAMPVLFRLSPDDGKTTVIHFAGDTMLGRRFYDPNGDDYTADGLLPLEPTVDDHMKLLAPVRALLEDADLTVVNLETTLSEQPYYSRSGPRPVGFHTTSDYVYASHLNGALALKQSGIDVVDIGNNHNYDLLENGLSTSLSTLDQAGLLHFGAGTNEANAWAPAVISSEGQTIAFVGCTTVRIPSSSITKTDVPYVASDLLKKGGAAYCSEAPLRAAIIAAKKEADAVVVMIHGGKEYSRIPLRRITYLTEIARQAGATLIINHHSHVVSGFSWKNQSLTAWSMGNFLFDQTVWPSFESYMLAVTLREGKVVRAYVEPLIIDGYLPHGLTGELADYVVRGAAGREAGPFVMESGAMEIDLEGRALQSSYAQTVDGGPDPGTIVALPPAQWISDFKGRGRLLLGRDLLWVGSFENEEVGSASGAAPLWDLDLGNIQIGRDYAYAGETGVRLTRGASSVNDVVSSNTHRVLVEPFTNLSITGMVRSHQGVPAFVQLSWYDATFGPSFLKTINPIEIQSDGTWQPFRFDARVPKNAVALGVYLRLSPPDKGTANVDFDNIRIIEWSRPGSPYSPLYNYALIAGSGDLTLAQQILPGAEKWLVNHPTIERIK